MTTPVAHGYPDYDRTLARNDVVYQSNVPGNSAFTQTYGPFFAGNARGIIVDFANLGAGSTSVTVHWGTDSAMSIVVHSEAVDLQNGDRFRMGFPAFGPWFTIGVEPVGGVTQWAITTVAVSESAAPFAFGVNPRPLITVSSAAIGAGATLTSNSPVVTAGDGEIMIFTSGVTWQLTLTAIDAAGTRTVIDVITQANGNPFRHRLFIPAQHIEQKITNNGGGGATFTSLFIAPSLTD